MRIIKVIKRNTKLILVQTTSVMARRYDIGSRGIIYIVGLISEELIFNHCAAIDQDHVID